METNKTKTNAVTETEYYRAAKKRLAVSSEE